MLNGWAGLSLSDVIALVVEDVDLEAVRRRYAGRQWFENVLSSNPGNEKAPEMFNHFRGFVLFNNGGEIGTLRKQPYGPTNTEYIDL